MPGPDCFVDPDQHQRPGLIAFALRVPRVDEPTVDATKERRTIEAVMLEAFAVHDSKSVQQTLRAMGEAALAVSPPIEEIHLVMPNKHYLLVNLEPFGLDNPNCIFLPTDEPAGRIEGTLRRG